MSMPAAQTNTPSPATMESVIITGDLARLTPQQRIEYVHAVCRSVGLNHLTQPFEYITLNGKLKLYAKKDATDQLRKINGVSIAIVSRTVEAGLFTAHARATDKTGRTDEDFGVVSIAGLRGETAANAIMKAVTKAKRRATLSISGLGFLDELETDDIEDMVPTPQPSREQSQVEHLRDQAPDPEAAEEVRPREIPRNGDSEHDWSLWAQGLMAYVRAAPDVDAVNDWAERNAEHLAALRKYDSAKHKRLIDMINHNIASRAEG